MNVITMYIWCHSQVNLRIYAHIWCACTVWANPLALLGLHHSVHNMLDVVISPVANLNRASSDGCFPWKVWKEIHLGVVGNTSKLQA
jgi:hypothetical protein